MERLLEGLFLDILNMSITASYIILFVLIARLFLNTAPKIYSYALWSVVLFRLLCPISFSSKWNILQIISNHEGGTKYIPSNIGFMTTPQVNTGIPMVDSSINASLPAATPYASVNPMQLLQFELTYLWFFGVLILLIYGLASFWQLRSSLGTALRIEHNIYESDQLTSPFVLGFFKPRIYLPVGLSEKEKRYIIEHEQTHIRRFDPLIKLVAFFTLSIHWFNPLVWISFIWMTKDMEMSCDEHVIKKLGADSKKEYSSTLLSLATKNSQFMTVPLAFGESTIKTRIKNILYYRSPKLWISILIAGICAVVVLAGASNPLKVDSLDKNPVLAKALYENRTSYVGNASSVVALVDLLPLPVGIERGEIILATDVKPYSLGINYGTEKAPDMPSQNELFINSALLFATIGNVDTITHIGHWGDQGLAVLSSSRFDYSFTRSQIENILGVNLQQYGQSEKGLADLIELLKQKSTPAQQRGEQTALIPTEPSVTSNQTLGTDMVSLDYASDDLIIFHGYFGLFVYDLDTQTLVRSLDLKPIGCQFTQGDSYCEVSVSTDGNTIQLHPMDNKEMFVYTVSDNTLVKSPYTELADSFQSHLVPTDKVIQSDLGNYSSQAVAFDTGEFGVLHTSDWNLGTLSYTRDDMMYALFNSK